MTPLRSGRFKRFDVAPAAVKTLVGRQIAKAVAGGDFALDLFVHLVDFFEAGGEQRQAAGHLGKSREFHALVHARGAELMFKVTDHVDGHVRCPQQIEDLAHRRCCGCRLRRYT